MLIHVLSCDLQVQWAGFDKLECGGDVLRQVLLLAYRSGFQVWDVEHADDVRQLESRHDGAVSFIQLLKKPIASKRGEDRFVDARPLLALAGGGTSTGSANGHDANGPVFNGTNGTYHNSGSEKLPTIVRFYSLKDHGYVHSMKFRSAVYSIRCSPRVVAVSQATQVCILPGSYSVFKSWMVLMEQTFCRYIVLMLRHWSWTIHFLPAL